MGKLVAQMTTSLDGFYTGPNDGPGRALGEGGERLHYWVFGGPWSYDRPPTGDATGVDKQLLDDAFARIGAVVAGRWTYDSRNVGREEPVRRTVHHPDPPAAR